jgi:hypothetical protein
MKIGLDEQATPYDSELCRTWFRDLILGIEYCESTWDCYAAAFEQHLLTLQ